jgi:hypothetical protein
LNHSLQIIGDEGIIYTKECWNYYAPCYLKKYVDKNKSPFVKTLLSRSPMFRRVLGLNPKKLKLIRKPPFKTKYLKNPYRIYYHDFARGIAEMALSLNEKRDNFLSTDFLVHVNEIVFAIQNAANNHIPYMMKTSIKPFDAAHLVYFNKR